MKHFKFVKKAGLWCVSSSIKEKDGKQKMTIEWFSSKEEAERRFNE